MSADEKIEKLAEWMKAAKHVVVHTGKKVSTLLVTRRKQFIFLMYARINMEVLR